MQTKSRIVTILLTLFLGGLGIHRFYLNQNTYGVLMLLFCWTIIPLVISIIDLIGFLIMSDQRFDEKYNSQQGAKYDLRKDISKEERRKLLEYDYQNGYITEDQYYEKRAELEYGSK